MNLWPLETTALKMWLNLEMWQDTKYTDVKQKILTIWIILLMFINIYIWNDWITCFMCNNFAAKYTQVRREYHLVLVHNIISLWFMGNFFNSETVRLYSFAKLKKF